MDELENEIKNLVIASLDLEGIKAEDIASQDALFGDGLGLDSIDALELGLALKNKYQVKLGENSALTREHFYSIASLALFVQSQRTAQQ